MKLDQYQYISSSKTCVELYEAMLRPRLIEEKMLLLLRQNKISKWFSGIGQEAISVGLTEALQPDEYILPMHRNLGVFTSRKVPLYRLFAQWQGTSSGYTKGRDRSFHFGSTEHHLVGMISHLGPQNGVAVGIALATILNHEKKVTAVFNGDGGTSEGDFHEAVNVAAVWNLPIIFVIENNGYALSTPGSKQFRCKHLSDKALGYGIEGLHIDGNNVLEVYETVQKLAADLRDHPRPVLLECKTFRMRGHEEASGIKYVPETLLKKWKKKDPIDRLESFLLTKKWITKKRIETLRSALKEEIDTTIKEAFSDPTLSWHMDAEIRDVFSPSVQQVSPLSSQEGSDKRFIDAIHEGLLQSMECFPNLVLMGQDIADYGGVFKVTEGLLRMFGEDRVRDTPICESAILGAALGLSVKGMKSMVEMQFADFVSEGFTQIINNIAKVHWRWGQVADVVIRMPTGAGSSAGPFHSQSNEAWFFHTPGLKIVYPSNPYDAKGLLNAAIEDPNPYLFFEHKSLYRSIRQHVPDAYYTIEVGKAAWIQRGDHMSIITYGMGVRWAKDSIKELPHVSIDLLDLRTLMPWDQEAVRETVARTGRVLILHEDTLTGGIGAEIAAWIAEHCFTLLDAPVSRIASPDTPVPFTPLLENQFLPTKDRIVNHIDNLIRY